MIAALSLAAGCGEPMGPPERFETTTVSGVLLEGGRPVGGGWIEFIPIDGTVGDQRSARIAADGSFRAQRVPVGAVALRLVNAPIRMPQGAAPFGRFSTPIRRKISAGTEAPLRIDLVDEAVLYQAGQPRRPKLDLDQAPSDRGGGAEITP
jgi:hypothetical protein